MREENLVRVLPDSVGLELGLWIAMHEGLKGNARCKVVFAALVKRVSAPAARGYAAQADQEWLARRHVVSQIDASRLANCRTAVGASGSRQPDIASAPSSNSMLG